MFNFESLIGLIHSYNNDMTVSKLAKSIGMSVSTMQRRLQGEGFTSAEIVRICKVMDIDKKDVNKYFFTLNVEFC